MSLAALHTDAHRRLAAVRAYPRQLAAFTAKATAVHVFKTAPATAHAMLAWHTDTQRGDAAPPPDFVASSGAPAFAFIGVAARRPHVVIGAIAAFTALPALLLLRIL